jgi:hypothetical protein
MAENESPNETLNDEQKPVAEESPAEKLDTEKPISPVTPGIESPESKEIKKEVNPNTE